MRAAAWATLAGVVAELGFIGWLYGLGHFFGPSASAWLMFGPLALPLVIAIPVYFWRDPDGGAWFLAAITFVAGAAGNFALAMRLTSPVVAVSPGLRAERGMVFRTASIHGHTVATRGGGFGGDTTIVNGSTSTLYLRAVVYGYGMQSDAGTPIPPGGVTTSAQKIEYLGPDHPPPDAIESEGFSDSRRWLTW